MKNQAWLALLFAPAWAMAQDCPSATNLVANCGFNASVAGFTPQEPGDSIAHVAQVGATALGAMRVTDTQADGGTDAEAETCVSLGNGPGVYRLGASFKTTAAGSAGCFVGFDEHVQAGCMSPNGNFVAGAPISANPQSFTRFQGQAIVGPAVASVELVILCDAAGQSTEFDVDDVAMVQVGLFASGFE